MNDSLARIARTLIQLVAALPVTVISTWLADQVGLDDGFAYPIAFVIVVVAQNALEELTGKGLLRQSSPPAKKDAEAVANIP
jgi:hypothetical protein